MARTNKKKEKNSQKYNAENEIIIGVTTKSTSQDKKKKTKDAKNKKKEKTKTGNSNKRDNKKKINNVEDKTKNKIIKKKNRKIKIVSFFIVLFIAIGGTIYFLTTPTFNITTIKVFGYETNSEDTYISLSGITLNETNIFQITQGGINKNLKENAYVESSTIKRKLPNVLEIYVEERTAEYQIKYNENYIYINNQGYILEISEEMKEIPEIIGISTINNDVVLGSRLNKEDLVKLDTILKILNSYKFSNIEEKITSIDVTDTSNYILNLDEINKKIYLGDASNISERILWLKTILPKEEGNKGTIFINGDLGKDKVYFKEEE